MNPLSIWQRVRMPGRQAWVASLRGRPTRALVGLLAWAALLLSAWQGGTGAAVGSSLAALVLAWALRRPPQAPGDRPVHRMPADETPRSASTPPDRLGTAAAGSGVGVMVDQVVPVWSRQLAVTREAGNDGMGQLLASFASVSDGLDGLTRQLDAFQPTAAPGAMATAIDAQRPGLTALLRPLHRAFAQRDALVTVLGDCATTAIRLQQLAKEARDIGRHTRLVAFNASIEANRGQRGHDGGSQQVASEVRTLAQRITTVCDQLDGLLGQLVTSTTLGHRDGLLHDTSAEELQLEIELRAREALQAMLTSLGAAMQGSAAVQMAGQQLREQLDEAFTHFQFGDRLAQMLQIISDDMGRFTDWVAQHPDASPADAHTWLQQLEQRYTMDEQRAEHHGSQHVDRGTEVEFF